MLKPLQHLAAAFSRWPPLLLTAALSSRTTVATRTLSAQFTSSRHYSAETEVVQPLPMDSTSSTKLPMQLYEPTEVADNEAAAGRAKDITLPQLMQTAGLATYNVIRSEFPDIRSMLCLAGKGNNGGDAYVVAKLALDDGFDVSVAQIGDPDDLKGDAATAYKAFKEAEGEIKPVTDEFSVGLHFDLVVDGLFGVGLSREIKPGAFTTAIEAVNESGKPVVSVDVPSGLLASTGAIAGMAIQADHTVTFIGLKRGLLTGKAADCVGQLHYASLGIKQEFDEIATSTAERVSYKRLSSLLPLRKATAHKGSFGKAVLIGGFQGMPGAIRMAGEACQRVGAGLTRVLTHKNSSMAVAIGRPELMVDTVEEIEEDDDTIMQQLDWATVVAIGPGLGQDPWGCSLLKAVLRLDHKVPLVLDADALNLLATDLGKTPKHSPNWVLTPHPGEAGRLLDRSVGEVESDRFQATVDLQKQYGGVVLLKGSGTVIYDGNKHYVVSDGNPGMASGGMGDTLTGIITGLLAQGLSLLDAARLGACLHARAADIVVQEYGERGLLASDLLPELRKLANPTRRRAEELD
eukprot:m.91119 g.91119  ORF g.91119 m.91119 type:complete len:576 (-) comp14895_c0_seq1:58-1785(-)